MRASSHVIFIILVVNIATWLFSKKKKKIATRLVNSFKKKKHIAWDAVRCYYNRK